MTTNIVLALVILFKFIVSLGYKTIIAPSQSHQILFLA